MEAVTVDLDVELLPADGTLTPTSAAPTSTTLAPDLASFFNHTVAFVIMSERRVQRNYKGVYRQYSALTQVFTWILALYVVLVVAADIIRGTLTSEKYFTVETLLVLAANLLVVFVAVKIALIIRWLLYWIVVAEMFTLIVSHRVQSIWWFDDDLSKSDRYARNAIWISLVVVEGLTIISYVVTHFIYPWVVRRRLLNAEWWWGLKRGRRFNSYRYRTRARCRTVKPSVVSYCGGLDEHGHPHGYGIWSDTSFHGEELRGQWEHGVPVGPFQSREHGSGYCFVNVRIAYCQNRREAQGSDVLYFPKHSNNGLRWGVASVECSVSGGFFSFLPHVTHLGRKGVDKELNSAEACLPLLRTPLDSTGMSDDNNRSFVFFEDTIPRSLESQLPLQLNEKEALVFIHGYNCSLDFGLNRFGQLLALGDFPPHIHPFVFSWPSGGVLAYFQARSVGCESEQTAIDFRNFLSSIALAGYSSVNIIAHSMGVRVYFDCLMRGLLDDIFVNIRLQQGETRAPDIANGAPACPRKIQLATLTFFNPDYSRAEFVRPLGAYDRSREFCKLITVYGDQMDGALWFSEVLSRRRIFDPLDYSMGKRVHRLRRDNPHNSARGRRESRASFRMQATESLGLEMAMEAAERNRKSHFPGVVWNAVNCPRDEDDEMEEAGHDRSPYLKMDVIDTTWMDNNVHYIRHNYFNLNPTIIEDYRVLVVHKTRARRRPGLMRTEGNMFIFLVAPSFVKND